METTLTSVSSLNLRMGRCSSRQLDEPILFICSVCAQKKSLGKNADVLVRLEMVVGGELEEMYVCDRCMDILVETINYGPRVLQEARHWEVGVRVARVSLVQEDIICGKCMKKAESHLFVKYDNLKSPASRGACVYETIRACSRCVASYIAMVRGTGAHKRLKAYQVGEEGRPWKFVVMNG